jgi:signal transduction histidine kinase
MQKIPFTVSARAARLIGRENITNNRGAVIELVKNCYDADAKFAFVIFKIKYMEVPKSLSKEEYRELCVHPIIQSCYSIGQEDYSLNSKFDEFEKTIQLELTGLFVRQNELYIIDNGIGMTRAVIENYWMTIGTDNKEYNYITDGSRVKVGAKGIGRFALDKLGNKCEMITKSDRDKNFYRWIVLWDKFEERAKNISDVYAELEILKEYNFKDSLLQLNVDNYFEELIRKEVLWKSGTLLKICDMRDFWTNKSIKELYDELETLIAPNERNENPFRVFFINNIYKELSGEINSIINRDYDYKLTARISEDSSVNIEIQRNEFDFASINRQQLEDHLNWVDNNFKLHSLNNNILEIKTTIEKLISSDNFNSALFGKIGYFDIVLFFMKQNIPTRDRERYPYKDIDAHKRKLWLKNFSGIRIYKDNFRVRPYGDIKGNSYDWLRLGDRAASSPAGPGDISKNLGDWKVRTNQMSGSIYISRLLNLRFDEKSSREGFIEDDYFQAFKNLIIQLIAVFEKDRQTIMQALNRLYEETHPKEQTEKILQDYIKENRGNLTYTEKLFSETISNKEKEIEELANENQLLRALASSGLVISNLAHELLAIGEPLLNIVNIMENEIKDFFQANGFEKKFKNQYENFSKYIDIIKGKSQSAQSWISFSLNSVKRDNRKRKKENLGELLIKAKEAWCQILINKGIDMSINIESEFEIYKYIFNIDFDSIVNNLIINSIYVFDNLKTSQKKIFISIENTENLIIMKYSDTGPGLLKTIEQPEEIFKAFFTTKKEKNGEPTGTGLGMWIIKNIVDYYQGKIDIPITGKGFKIKISFPKYKGEGNG